MDEDPTQAATHLTPDPVEAAEAGARREAGLARRAARALALDVTPLRESREFRLLFVGQAVSFFGSMMTFVALPWQTYQLTRSPLATGLLGVAEFVPILLMAFVGGALADAVDRRRMVLFAEALLAAGTCVLVVNSLLPEPRVWVLYLCAALFAALNGLQRPSLDALVPRLVRPGQLPAALALRSLGATVGMIGGPALGGLLVAAAGPALTYTVDFTTFAASLAALWMMRAVPPPAGAEGPSLRSVVEGLRYARSRPELLGTYLVDINAMFFGMPMALFPAVAEGFGGASVGLLYAAPAAGAMCVTLTSGWTRHVNRHGLCVAVAAAVWGLAVVGFGLAPTLWAALLFLALAGAADMVSGLFRSLIWNQTIPDHLRGRLAGIEVVSYTTGPLLGNAESGMVAGLFGVRASVVSGGVLCVAGTALLSLLLPQLIRYDGRAGRAQAGRRGGARFGGTGRMKRLRLAALVLLLLAALAAYYYHYESAVRVETVQLASALVGKTLPYRVLLPPGYGLVTSRATRYPVLYLLHGWGGRSDSWLSNSSLKAYAAEHRLIVVTPEGEKGWYTDGVSGGGYESYVLRELIADVDRRFRTIANRRGRGVAGYSMGGYGALKLAFRHPEAFVFAGSTSGALDAAARTDDESIMRVFGEAGSAVRFENDLPRLAREFPEERRGALPFLYLDCGLRDHWFESNRDFAATLAARGISHEYRQLPGEHVWPYWDGQLQEILRVASERMAAPE